MNMKKTIGICATLLAALLCAVPQSAQATGKIRSVDVYSSPSNDFPNVTTPLKCGAKVYVRFRLVNPCWAETQTAADGGNPDLKYPWEFWYTGGSLSGLTAEQIAALATPPRLGLWISGTLREATCVNFPLGPREECAWLTDVMPSGAKHYTDLVFMYEVKAGDLALPIQLANASGTGPATGEEPYYFKYEGRETQWRLECSTGGVQRVVADFAFGPSNLDDDPDFHNTDLLTWETYAMGRENRDMTLIMTGAYIQDLNFEDPPDPFDPNSDVWRTISQGSTTAEPGAPSIAIEGENGAATQMDLYIWTGNTNIAEIVKGGQVVEVKPYPFHDGVTRLVGKIHIKKDAKSESFSVKATGNVGDTTQVFLSDMPTNILNASGNVINNFITRTVKVGEPEKPGISVKLTKTKIDASADYSTPGAGVNVELRGGEWPGPGDLLIPIKVTVKNNPGLDVTNFVALTERDEYRNTYWDDVLTVKPHKTSADLSLWMYATRGTVDTENGLLVEVDTNRLFQVEAARNFFTGKFYDATVVVTRSTPEINASALPPITDVEANSPKEITINVADAYGELHDPCRYTVYWSRSGGVSASDYVTISNLAATATGDLTFSVTYLQKGDYTSRYYVKNYDGKSSTNVAVSVSVKAQKVIEATTLQKKFAEDAFNEQAIVTLDFGDEGFSLPNGDTEGYIFFVPRSENASNLVTCADLDLDAEHDWKAGYPVYAGETSVGPFMMTLLDGNSKGLTMAYDIIVRTADSMDAGEIVSSWNSKGFSFGVTNVVPEVTQVSMSGTRLSVNGGTMGAHASLGVSKTFTAQTSEPSDEDLYADQPNYTDDQKAFTTEWSFDYGSGAPDVKYVYGPPSTALSYAFTQAGTCTVTVRMCDKDMDHNRGVFGPEFTFKVIVDAKPAVTLSPFSGLTMFYETSIGQTYGKLNVGLSMVPTAEINVHLDVTRAGADDGNYPLPVLNSYDIVFNGSKTNDFVWFTALDGTALGESQGYNISAVVTTTSVNADGVSWSNLYTSAVLPVTIVNNDPEIVTRAGTNEIWKAENENFRIEYTVRDVPADVTHGLSVTWQTSEGFSTNYTITASSLGGAYTTYKGSSPVFSFTSAGSKTVTLLLEDKDGGFDQQQWKYYVVPSKALLLYPRQPDQLRGRGGNLSAFSANYTGAAGLGDGRVWAEGSVVDFKNFIHKYTFDPTVSAVDIYARGYKVGDVDNGSLQPGPDITIDADGRHYKNGTYSSYYTSRELSGLDSYFYCWILDSAGEGGGGYTGSLLNGTLTPAVEVKDAHIADGHQRATLPDYEEDAETYPPTELEAIFSKERYPADNVGDINQDGIPDVYAVGKSYDGGFLYQFATGGAAGGEGGETATASDIKPTLATFNEDGDYLPPATITGGGIPATADGWMNVGERFTADLEVRGFHSGLNYRVGSDGLNYNVIGAWVSDPSFSPAESNAIVYMNKKLNIYEFAWPFDATNAEHVANWNTGLNLDRSWIPENRTDPTMEDTDGDGFPDGFEYYFWYRATVGWIDDKGAWKRLEGERFQLEDIAKGVPIPSDEIAELFNPTVKATGNLTKRDSDNDGLTDLEEFALGTNPLHWDTDGDGMSDLWEVMRGMNPLKAPDPDPAKREMNLDGDYMASFTTEKEYTVLTFTNAENQALSVAVKGDVSPYLDDDGEFAADSISNLTAIAVYRYGGSGSAYSPVSCGTYGKDESISYLGEKGRKRTCNDNSHKAWGDIRITTSKPLDAAEVDISGMTFVSFETNKALRLVHDQVYAQFGFDPRTAWGMNVNGCVCNRWDPNKNPTYASDAGEAGLAVNTAPYSNLDEYLVLKYRYMTRDADGKMRRNLQDDLSKIAANQLTIAGVLSAGTTNPNVPFEKVDYTVTGASSDNEGSSDSTEQNSLIPTYTSTNHGADTDEDGVPDGWELYVAYNPNNKEDGTLERDGDKLSLVNEYAGTDSCNAYEYATNGVGEATIYAMHPGHTKGWYNKFFPTDPWDIDTDGDGLSDLDEGATWSAFFQLGKSSDKEPTQHTYTFIYGDPEDDNSLCIRGGGLNPCSVDTDFDLLPDPWEHDFAGVVFTGGVPGKGDSKYGTGISLSSGVIDTINRNDGINSASGGVSVVATYITAGMDGTFGPRKDSATIIGDAVSSYVQVDPRTGTKRNFDFDNDGLQNFQEYLVQSLRHLRYDDTETPLMGSYLPNGVAGSRTYVKFLPMQAWDGAAFYKTAKATGFTGLSARGGEGFRYRDLGYFVRPPKAWDPLAQNTVGLNVCANYEEPGYRVMLRPAGLSPNADEGTEDRMPAERYASTDPRLWDSDEDGMDDYYELFHGLNPLLGKVDMIGNAYMVESSDGIRFSSYYNAWVGWPAMPPMTEPVYDAMMYPWFMGVAEADADGDGLRNTDEALLVNTPSPQNYHTDPTPLWMTDSSAQTSFTKQYYGRDMYMTEAMMKPDLTHYFWFGYVDGADQGGVDTFMFSFEENEGFDTDHDWLPDGQETTHVITDATDAKNGADPDCRQAIYLPGENAALISYSGDFHKPVGENYAMLRQFTVEAWIRPEASTGARTIVTRVCDYAGDTLSNAVHQLRANFRIGINDQGIVYGQYDSDDAVPSGSDFGTTTVLGNKVDDDVWTHVALSFNGSALILYVNGTEAKRAYSNLIPANGLVLTGQSVTPESANFGKSGYTKVPSRLIVGADAAKLEAMLVDKKSSWENYGSFYKGWIDEVRVWDGARTADQIKSDYQKRYSLDDLSALRDEVYSVWLNGGTHNNNDGHPDLPAELLLHYNFQQLPSEVSADYVASEPSGFTAKVIDNVKWNGHGVDLRCGWWSALPLASEVYGNRALVPWVRNMCGALPTLDGSTPDSRYWSELLGGVTLPTEAGVSTFSFPNEACPYSYWNYMGESYFRQWVIFPLKSTVGESLSGVVNDLWNRFKFDERTGFIGGADLLPLGGAYAKRCVDFWDGEGSTDASTATADDLDIDSLPDWWEAYAAEHYGADASTLTASTVVDYALPSGEIVKVAAWQAYQMDLARGLLPGATDYDAAYANVADADGDGIADWWQKMWGVGPGTYIDSDNDGLYDYHEYWLSVGGVAEGFGAENGFPMLNPRNPRSLLTEKGQAVPDYFLSLSGTGSQWDDVYFGFITTDHDFIEDWWEKQYANGYSNASVYDPLNDWDENGWSNYAEARYQMWRNLYSADQFDGWNVDGSFHVDYSPEPALAVRSTYLGVQDLTSNNPHPQIPTIVTATRTSERTGRIDAKYVAVPSDVNSTDDGNSCNQYLGAYRAGTVMRGFLSPGCVVPTSVLFYKANVGDADYKYWKLVWQTSVGGPGHWVEGKVTEDNIGVVTNHYSGSLSLYTDFIQRYPQAQIEQSPLKWELIATVVPDVQNRMGTIIHSGSGKKVGVIDLHSGEYAFDQTALATVDSNADQLPTTVFMVAYASKIGNEWPQTLYYSNTKELDNSVEQAQRGVGHVMEGENMITSLIDLDQSGDYTPGEPFGVISGVDVGWHKVPEQVVELRDTSHVVPRLDLLSLTDDRTAIKGAAASLVTYTGATLDTAAKTAQISINRTAINGIAAPNRRLLLKQYVLPDGRANSHARTFIHEGDILKGGKYDLDWTWLAKDAAALGIENVVSATYQVSQRVPLLDGGTSNIVLATFVNTFDSSRSVPNATSPYDGGTVFSASPTFKWTCPDDTMTAFDLQVFDENDNLVYDSGAQVLPGRVDGAYTFTPWLYADAPVTTNGAPVFADGSNYFWRVAMMNAKYNTALIGDESAWSVKRPFKMDLSHKELTTGYGIAKAVVRYYGPCGRQPRITDTGTGFDWGEGEVQDIQWGKGLVIVEAFENADFHGRPMAQIRLSDYTDLYSITNITTANATLRGLDPGTLYFRAYIDQNNNGKRDPWESWGYANHVNTSWQNANGVRQDWEEWGNSVHYDGNGKAVSEAIYDPLGVVVTDNPADVPTFVIYIEDCDLNRNNLPDSLEDMAEEAAVDSDGDGMSDAYEEENGLDPADPDDTEFSANGDVMAYAVTNLTMVTTWNGSDAQSATNRYVLMDANVSAVIGADASTLGNVRAVYDYGGQNGLGAVTTPAGKVYAVKANAEVVLVHAQVYEFFGFNSTTANSTATQISEGETTYGANTKPFTALDKYLVCRYLQNVYGLADEKVLDASGKSPLYSLPIGNADNDRDGVPDGWELYVMFGTEAVPATLGAAKISPFESSDARKLAPSGDVTVLAKWNGGAPAYDPWSNDSNGNGIPDEDEIKYVLDTPYGDEDNDQLPNFTEFIIGSGFINYFDNVAGISATDAYSLTSLIPDYFRRVGKLYLGEMFTDHDFMEDLWEDQFDASKITRGYYDPWNDPDNDGWSNFAECRAGTDPTRAEPFEIKGVAVHNYPEPTVHATLVMGPEEGMLNGKLVVQAFSQSHKLEGGSPDATWTVMAGTNTVSGKKSSYFGVNPNCEVTFWLPPGSVKSGTVSIDFLDPAFKKIEGSSTTYGNLSTAEWQTELIEDRPLTNDTSNSKGELVAKPTNKPSYTVGSIDYSTGRVTIDFTKLPKVWRVEEGASVDDTSTSLTYTLMHLDTSHVRATWEAATVGGDKRTTLLLRESDLAASQHERGHLREGRNMFVAFLDLDGSGSWDPGEPYGVAQDVDVGWSDAEFTVELTRTTPIMARFSLSSAMNGAAGATDRDVDNNGKGYLPNELSKYPGTNFSANAHTRVRVVRNWINLVSQNGQTSYSAVLLDRYIDLSVHPTLTEADLFADGTYDLDWGTLNKAYNGANRPDSSLTNATYRVVIGEGDVGTYENFGNNLPVLFSNIFEPTGAQTPTVPDPSLAQIVYSSRPTFRWSHTNSVNKAYPAFCLRIYTDASKRDMIYDSGVQRAPARNSDGMYEWTAPVYADMVTSNGRVFTTTNNYYWAVSMLDAKFYEFSSSEVATPFRLSTSGNLQDGKGFGSIAVRVKYFGPIAESLSATPTVMNNLIRVQAFTNPDFSGLPEAETYVTDVSSIASESAIEMNAVLNGVAPGNYYVRAYIDTDGDGVKSDWESWGYACSVGDPNARAVYRPMPITLSYSDMLPTVTVFMEDADRDGDGFPDAWEVRQYGNLTTQGTISGNTFFATVNPLLASSLGAYSKVSQGLRSTTSSSYPQFLQLMSASPLAATQLLSGTQEGAEETTVVRINSFSLEDGLELEVKNVSVSDAAGLIEFNGTADVGVYLECGSTPDFADAKEVFVKTISISSNASVKKAVTAEELAAARAQAPDARFFKAVIKK